jgi:tRNA threonylcarbamoyladenosine biosynthesis protein TsaE
LFGDLAAGKTTLIKGIAAGAGGCSQGSVSSPTFVYLNVYQAGQVSGLRTVYHFDLYRLKHSHEFLSMGFDEYFDAGGVTCVEWPERIEGLLPPKRFEIYLSYAGLDVREIKIVELGA